MGNSNPCSRTKSKIDFMGSDLVTISKNIDLEQLQLQDYYCKYCKKNYVDFTQNIFIDLIQTPILGTCIKIQPSNIIPYSFQLQIKIDLNSVQSKFLKDFIFKLRYIDSQLMLRHRQKGGKLISLKKKMDSECEFKNNPKLIFPGDIVRVKRGRHVFNGYVRLIQNPNRVWVSRIVDGKLLIVKLSKVNKETYSVMSKLTELSFHTRKLIGEKIISYVSSEFQNCIPSEECMKQQFSKICEQVPIISLIRKNLSPTWVNYFNAYISSFYDFNCLPFILPINIDLRMGLPTVYSKIGKISLSFKESDIQSFANLILGHKCKFIIDYRLTSEGLSLWGKQISTNSLK